MFARGVRAVDGGYIVHIPPLRIEVVGMTLYLALDPVSGLSQASAGEIVAINATAQVLIDAGFTVAGGYTGDRVQTIDETDSSVWDDDCAPGWYWTLTGGVQAAIPLTPSQIVAQDIRLFQNAVEREAVEWEQVVAEENFQPHTDSGHSWSNDLLHSLIKPNIRLYERLLDTAKGLPNNANRAAYKEGNQTLAHFIAGADYGVINIYRNALKSVWRPLRAGGSAYGYDVATGNIRVVDTTPVQTAVTYPDGETVATWDALAAVRSL